jgi:amidase
MARSVDDLRVVLEAIQGPDGVDSEVPPVPWSDASAVERRDLRVATVPPLAEFEVQKEIRSALDTLTEELRANGAQVTPCVADVDLKEQVQLGDQLFWCIANTFESQEDVPSATLETYLGYLDRRDTLIARWDDFFTEWDVLLLAAGPTTAFLHSSENTALTEEVNLNVLSPVTGCPAIVLPLGVDDQGVAIRRRTDGTTLGR